MYISTGVSVAHSFQDSHTDRYVAAPLAKGGVTHVGPVRPLAQMHTEIFVPIQDLMAMEMMDLLVISMNVLTFLEYVHMADVRTHWEVLSVHAMRVMPWMI